MLENLLSLSWSSLAWIGASLLLSLLLLIFIVGCFLPDHYPAKSVVKLDCDATKVWDALQDFRKCPVSGSMTRKVEQVDADESGVDGAASELPRWKEDIGNGEVIVVTTVLSDPPKRLIREMKSTAMNMKNQWEYTLEAVTAKGSSGSGGAGAEQSKTTQLSLSGAIEFSPPYTWHVPLFRVIMSVTGAVQQGIDDHLDMVAKSLGVSAKRDV